MNPCIYLFLVVFFASVGVSSPLLKVEHKLKEISSLEARFTQKDSTGNRYRGTLFLKRPWKFKMQYDDPSPFLIVSDGNSLIYEDHSTFEATYLPLESSPLSFLLDKEINLQRVLEIEKIEEERDRIVVYCRDRKNYFSLHLYFSPKEKSIIGWTSIDAQGNKVIISLDTIKENVPLENKIFSFQQKPRWLVKGKK